MATNRGQCAFLEKSQWLMPAIFMKFVYQPNKTISKVFLKLYIDPKLVENLQIFKGVNCSFQHILKLSYWKMLFTYCCYVRKSIDNIHRWKKFNAS